MAGAKQKMLDYLLQHVGEFIPNEKLRQVSGNISDWARCLRTLRQEGWKIEAVTKPRKGYILHSATKGAGRSRGAITDDIRYRVFERDHATCQRCGKTVKDGVKLHVDHVVPVEWGGGSELSNLQTLCAQCNQGKKDYVQAQDPKLMQVISAAKSAYQKLKIFFEAHPNEDVSSDILDSVSGIRDWERTVRSVRKKEGMNIKASQKNGIWYYRFTPSPPLKS